MSYGYKYGNSNFAFPTEWQTVVRHESRLRASSGLLPVRQAGVVRVLILPTVIVVTQNKLKIRDPRTVNGVEFRCNEPMGFMRLDNRGSFKVDCLKQLSSEQYSVLSNNAPFNFSHGKAAASVEPLDWNLISNSGSTIIFKGFNINTQLTIKKLWLQVFHPVCYESSTVHIHRARTSLSVALPIKPL